MREKGLIYLNKESVNINGYNFYGDPITPSFGNWSFMCKRESIYKHWELIPKDTDVLITHGPPKGVLDLSYSRENKLEFCGDSALLKAINKIDSIKLSCFGHLHNCENIINNGILKREDKIFSNGSCVKDGSFDKGLINFGNLIEI